MITIHQANATTVTGSGLGVLDNQIINPQVSEELNASFTLSFDYPAWGEHANQLTLGAIVACPVPWTDTKQAGTAEGLVDIRVASRVWGREGC